MRRRQVTGLLLAGVVVGFGAWAAAQSELPAGIKKVGKGIGILVSRLREQGPRVVALWIRDHGLRRMWGMSPADTSYVAPRLYVGGQHYRHGLARMAALGIRASLSLRDETDDQARGVALERHLWLRTVDDTPPTVEQLTEASEFIRQAIDEGHGVYVHCAAGVGRAPTTAAAYLVSTGLEPEQAWSLIRKGRPFIRPKRSQFAQIANFHQVINGKRPR